VEQDGGVERGNLGRVPALACELGNANEKRLCSTPNLCCDTSGNLEDIATVTEQT